MNYLDFEEPIKELHTQIEKLRESEKKAGVDMSAAIAELEEAAKNKTKEIYSKLDSWQRVQVSRHPDRPYTLQYIEYISGNNWIELHGDRTSQLVHGAVDFELARLDKSLHIVFRTPHRRAIDRGHRVVSHRVDVERLDF